MRKGTCIALAAVLAAAVFTARAASPYDAVPATGTTAAVTGDLVADNPAHGLHITYTATGERITPVGPSTGWAAGLIFTGYGAPGGFIPLSPAQRHVVGNRVELVHGAGLTEWWSNAADGLHRGFEIGSLPASAGSGLYLEFAPAGTLNPHLDLAANALHFALDDGQPVLSYTRMHAVAADGRTLKLSLATADAAGDAQPRVRVQVDTAAATFPVHVEWTEGWPKLLRDTTESVTASVERVPADAAAPRAIALDGAITPVLEAAPFAPGAIPGNDQCSGAITIPNTAFPVVTTPVDVTEATTTGDPTALCASTSNDIWYKFTSPSTVGSGKYTFTTCAAAGATGETMPDTVLLTYATSCPTTSTSYLSCNDDDTACTSGNPAGQSSTTIIMGASATLYVLVGRYNGTGSVPITPETAAIQVQVSLAPPPTNDNCTSPTALSLNVPVLGTTVGATNDFASQTGATCFSGVGQTTTSAAPGRDTVYSFTAPTDGNYSFKVSSYTTSTSQNLVLHSTLTCPTGTPPLTPTCFAGANRLSTGGTGEEIMCKPLTAGQTLYVIVDDNTTNNLGSDFWIEANPCTLETEPNDTTATAQAPVCGLEGTMSAGTDVDFFQLGAPVAGSRVFSLCDGLTSNSTDYDMRVTTATDTLEYDDADASSSFGSLSPNVAGTPLTGVDSFVRINRFNSTTASEPYRLYTTVQPPSDYATPESEPNSSLDTAGVSPANYFSAVVTASGADLDVYRVVAEKGDVIFGSIDGDPTRNNTPINPAIFVFDNNGFQLLGLSDASATSNTTSGAGSLTATTPFSPGEAMTWRARYTGVYYVGVNNQGATTGDYLISLGVNCKKGTDLLSDVALTSMTAAPDPIATGGLLKYTMVVNNAGPNIAMNTKLLTQTPPGTTFDSITGDGVTGWYCYLPTVGGSGSVDCRNDAFAPGATTTLYLNVRLGYCLGDGTPLNNNATVQSVTTDTNLDNNSASAQAFVSDSGGCDDGNLCTTIDACDAGQCVGTTPPNCDDGDVCTFDSCDMFTGCAHDIVDYDADTVCDALDCAPYDANVWAIPAEVSGVVFTDLATFGWSSLATQAGPGTAYGIVRGDLAQFPVGSGSETCLGSGVAGTTQGDAAVPAEGTGAFYLVRGENSCQKGTYGFASSGAERLTTACP